MSVSAPPEKTPKDYEGPIIGSFLKPEDRPEAEGSAYCDVYEISRSGLDTLKFHARLVRDMGEPTETELTDLAGVEAQISLYYDISDAMVWIGKPGVTEPFLPHFEVGKLTRPGHPRRLGMAIEGSRRPGRPYESLIISPLLAQWDAGELRRLAMEGLTDHGLVTVVEGRQSMVLSRADWLSLDLAVLEEPAQLSRQLRQERRDVHPLLDRIGEEVKRTKALKTVGEGSSHFSRPPEVLVHPRGQEASAPRVETPRPGDGRINETRHDRPGSENQDVALEKPQGEDREVLVAA